MPRRARSAYEVERTVYFYRANIGDDPAGDFMRFDPRPALAAIDKLTFQDDARYLGASTGDVTCCWIDGRDRLRIANVRRTGLPQVDSRGKLSPLSIPASSGLVEETHVAFFPDNVVGMLFNFHGPRISRLAEYLKQKVSQHCPEISFDALIRTDVTKELARLQDIRLFQLKLHSSWADQLRSADRSLAAALATAANAGDAGEIEIILRPKSYSRETLHQRLIPLARQILGMRDVETGASRFRVRGLNSETGSVSEIDLLSDKIVSKQFVVLADERSRALESRSAYRAIEEAFREMQDDISTATSMS